jgi:uncharacterized protein (DUF983 family)
MFLPGQTLLIVHFRAVARRPHNQEIQQEINVQTTAKGPLSTGIRGRCPRCGTGKLFRGFLKLAPCCNVCGLDYGFANPADGPAFFIMTVMAIPVVGFALWFDATYAPPWWVHLVTTLPLLIVACLAPLRPLKGWLVCTQYHYKAA